MTEQSQFFEDQATSQPPPETLIPKPGMNPKTRNLILVGSGLFGILIILLITLTLIGTSRPPAVVETPTPMPPGINQISGTQAQIQRIRSIVDEADPQSNTLPPPQIDMSVSF